MSPTPRAKFKRSYLGIRPWTRHSLVLLVAGFVYIMVGVVYIRTPDGGPTWEALSAAREWLDLDQWAFLWVVVGILSIVSSKWPPVAETWGYMALTALAAGWGSFYILGVIFSDSPVPAVGVGLVWWLVAFMWWAISGLISPEKIGEANGRG